MALMLIDGNSIINRAFFGVKELNAPDGTPTNAVFGFLNILSKLREDYAPESVAVAFDLKAPTFRHKAYAGYKAQRKGMPEELAVQVPLLKSVLDAMSIRRYEIEGFEADDILGTVSQICDREGQPCIVVTGDRDSLQLISENTSVCLIKTRMGSTETKLYTPEVFEEEYGFEPVHLIDLKALMGDSSDNIPGVPGVGEKTALQLVRTYRTVDALYTALPEAEDIKAGVKGKLAAGEDSARMSYMLATIFREVPLDFDTDSRAWPVTYTDELYGIFKRLGFQKMIAKYNLTAPEQPAGAPTQKIEYAHICPDEDFDFAALAEELKAAEAAAVRAETNLDSVELALGNTVYQLSWNQCGEHYNALLKQLFSPEVSKVACGAKDLIRLALAEGLEVGGFVFDPSLAEYLLDCLHGDYSPEYLTARYLDRDYAGLPDLLALRPLMEEKLREEGLDRVMFEIEMPLCPVLAEMETAGFRVDRTALYEFGESLTAGIEETRQRIYDTAGYEFNINSPKQLGTFLFEKLMLPGKRTKTGWSTGAEVLEKLRDKHPVIDDVLEFRTLTKLKSTYADGLLSVISEDGRIHTSFQMTVTATGRLSSTEPNLQNIPIRKAVGAEIRKTFIASPGNVLVDADYSQIELRLLAAMTDDEAMIAAFNSGEDFHRVTAASVFGVPVALVTPQMRSSAKAVNFGIVYGISAFSLSQDIKVPVSVAKEYMDAYFDRYPGVQRYMDKVIKDAYANGKTVTMFGRKRPMPELKNSNFNVRSFGERVARNMPIQGTAADVIKLAMIAVSRRFREEGLSARLLLQVHDELIVECPEEEQEKVSEILKTEMEHVLQLKVPLTAEVGCGRSWAEAH